MFTNTGTLIVGLTLCVGTFGECIGLRTSVRVGGGYSNHDGRKLTYVYLDIIRKTETVETSFHINSLSRRNKHSVWYTLIVVGRQKNGDFPFKYVKLDLQDRTSDDRVSENMDVDREESHPYQQKVTTRKYSHGRTNHT